MTFDKQDTFRYPDLSNLSLEDLYQKYKKYLYAVARRGNYTVSIADLAIDDVLLKIHHGKYYYNPNHGPFTNYLAKMMWRACSNEVRRDKHYVFQPEDIMTVISDDNDMTCSMDSSLRAETCQRMMEEALQRLSKEVRSTKKLRAFVMTVLQGYSPSDVAKHLSVTTGFVYQARFQLLSRFRTLARNLDMAG